MKRYLTFIIIICMLLPGCGKTAAPEPSPTGPVPTVAMTEIAPLDTGESLKMQCFMAQNRALLLNGSLYTYEFDSSWKGVLGAYDINDSGLKNFRIIAEDCEPRWLCGDGDRLYYINLRRGGIIESIKPDGSERKVLLDESCKWLQLHGGKLYFCDEKNYFCSLEGEEKTVLLAESCAFPYILEDGLIYTGEDGHIRYTDGVDTLELSFEKAEAPVIVENELYYSAGEKLCRTELKSLSRDTLKLPALYSQAEIIAGEKLCIRGVSEENGLKQWTNTVGKTEYAPYSGYRLMEYAAGDMRVECRYNPDGRIRSFIFISDGTEICYMGGEIKIPG